MSAREDIGSSSELSALRDTVARVQHEINNPLAALLAESQLLSQETGLSPELRQTAERMTHLVRRVMAAVKQLEEVRGEPRL
jgi:signal transduction histidine kinase